MEEVVSSFQRRQTLEGLWEDRSARVDVLMSFLVVSCEQLTNALLYLEKDTVLCVLLLFFPVSG